MRKRLLSTLLALCMVLALLPAAAFAADDGGDSGETVVETVGEDSGEIVVVSDDGDTGDDGDGETDETDVETDEDDDETDDGDSSEDDVETDDSDSSEADDETDDGDSSETDDETADDGSSEGDDETDNNNSGTDVEPDGGENPGTQTSDLPVLGTPTNLRWDSEHPGRVLWEIAAGEHQARFRISFYQVVDGDDDKLMSIVGVIGPQIVEMTAYHLDAFISECNIGNYYSDHQPFEAGDYYFTVQVIGDDINYVSGEEVSSKDEEGGVFTYLAPENKLDTPEQGSWDWPYALWDAVEEGSDPRMAGYEVMIAFAKSVEEINGGGSTLNVWGGKFEIIVPDVPEGQEEFFHYCSFRIRALSNNINEIQSSDYSPWSEPYDLQSLVGDILDKLKELLPAEGAEADAEAIKTGIQELAKEDFSNFVDAMRLNSGVANMLKAMEEALEITTNVEVKSEVADKFNAQDISVVGAGLNELTNENNDITLNVGRAQRGDVLDTLYNNAVSFSLELDNVEHTSQLTVPVQITMPIPASINPAFLVILHYHSDGSYEPVSYAISNKNGTNYASFVLTSFSDFVMYERNYAINVASSTNGSVTADAETADAGKTVTLTVTPEDGFELNDILVSSSKGSVTVNKVNDTTYTFTMPDADVDISAEFGPIAAISPTLAYTPYEKMSAADKGLYYGGKLEISGLTPNAKYVVTFDNGVASGSVVPRIAHVVTADENGKITLGCQSTMRVMVFAVTGTNVTTDLKPVYYVMSGNTPSGKLVSQLPLPASGT